MVALDDLTGKLAMIQKIVMWMSGKNEALQIQAVIFTLRFDSLPSVILGKISLQKNVAIGAEGEQSFDVSLSCSASAKEAHSSSPKTGSPLLEEDCGATKLIFAEASIFLYDDIATYITRERSFGLP